MLDAQVMHGHSRETFPAVVSQFQKLQLCLELAKLQPVLTGDCLKRTYCCLQECSVARAFRDTLKICVKEHAAKACRSCCNGHEMPCLST